jgi:glycosyltransferase involved in cell wall biosynthesis
MITAKTIGIFHYQLGSTDGVSLEVEKWKQVLEEMGHKVILCAGRLGSQEGILLPELYHHRPEIEIINQNILGERKDLFLDDLIERFNDHTDKLVHSLEDIIHQNNIDTLLVNNIWSVAMNIPAAVALESVRKSLRLHTVAHHHDFYWERNLSPNLDRAEIRNILDNYLPPEAMQITHVVINSLAQSSLMRKKDISSTVVPNVFDFTGSEWVIDEYNQDLRQAIGLNDGDICVLQATRIVPRKGIELAIDVVHALNEPSRRRILQEHGLYDGRKFTSKNKIVLVLAGYDRDDPTGKYLGKLEAKAKKLNVDLRHIDNITGRERRVINGQKIYGLWDTYAIADLVTYPGLWEGWGNQLLEAIKAKLPIVIFEYPVYIQDIKKRDFDVISLGSKISGRDNRDLVQISDDVIQHTADQCVVYLTNRAIRKDSVDKNFLIGKKHYSFDALKNILKRWF